MSDAGVMGSPAIEGKDFDQQIAELGGSVSYGCNDSYFTISISGEDANMNKIMNLVNRQLLMPYLEQKQLDNLKGSEFFSRLSRQKRTAVQKSALLQYALYGKKSSFLDEVKFIDVWNLDGVQVQRLVASARTYALDVFYCGTLTQEQLVPELPLTEGMQASKSPFIQDRVEYTKPTILFLPNSNVQQADLYFYINGRPYDIASDVASDAFNQYMSGGFTGLIMYEIREKRSMAYTAYGVDATPALPGKDCYFYGYVGTQSDKVADAISVYMDILNHSSRFVHIMTPYLILDGEMSAALCLAASRGVDVKVILPGIPDKKGPYALAKSHYAELLDAGVKIYEFTPGFVHSKLFVCDDVRAVVGTINLDFRSFFLHFECAAYIWGNPVVDDVEADFTETLKECQRMTLKHCKELPLYMKIYGRALRLIAPLM